MDSQAVVSSLWLSLLQVLGALQVLRSPQVVIAAEEQALIATIKLRSNMGGAEERRRIVAMEGELSDAMKRSKEAAFDGDEFGNGVCTIYMYGSSAGRLFSVASPILEKFRAPVGSYVTKRYGKPGAKQERIALSEH